MKIADSRERFSGSLLRHVVVSPEVVAEGIVSAVERDRGELFVPRFYRVAVLAQALVPRLVEKVGARGIRPSGD